MIVMLLNMLRERLIDANFSRARRGLTGEHLECFPRPAMRDDTFSCRNFLTSRTVHIEPYFTTSCVRMHHSFARKRNDDTVGRSGGRDFVPSLKSTPLTDALSCSSLGVQWLSLGLDARRRFHSYVQTISGLFELRPYLQVLKPRTPVG